MKATLVFVSLMMFVINVCRSAEVDLPWKVTLRRELEAERQRKTPLAWIPVSADGGWAEYLVPAAVGDLFGKIEASLLKSFMEELRSDKKSAMILDGWLRALRVASNRPQVGRHITVTDGDKQKIECLAFYEPIWGSETTPKSVGPATVPTMQHP
jgi:hypothetical protein